MKNSKITRRFALLAAAVAMTIGSAAQAADTIKVGVLHSLSGTMAISETTLKDTVLMLIDEQNKKGGVLGKKLEAVVVDPASNWPLFAEKAEQLLVKDKVAVVFGCWTSVSRKSVLPVFEKNNGLLFYPVQYEGEESSKNVIYTGAVPNQQQDEFVPWLVKKFGKKFYLIGSNYIYPKEENNYCKKLLEKLGGEVVAEEYVPLGHSEFSSVINKIRATQPNVIFSTVVGDSVVALHRQYKAAGLDPEKMPMASLTTSENEVAAMGGEAAAGHFTSAPYFMVHKSPENEKFVEAYKKRWGADKVTHFVSEACYFQTYLFKQAVEKLATSDLTPPNIRDAVKGEGMIAPQGKVQIEPENLHTWLWPKIAQAKSNGQFEILVEAKEWLKPVPYAAYPGQSCTEKGLVEKS